MRRSAAGLQAQFSRGHDGFETPHDLFAELDAEFSFTLDVCATAENAKCPSFYTRNDNGLTQPWVGRCWCNPPYGREIAAWLKKARESVAGGALVVCLVPARTDTAWWHDLVMEANEIRLLRGRLTFHGTGNKAPFASAVVIFRPSGG